MLGIIFAYSPHHLCSERKVSELKDVYEMALAEQKTIIDQMANSLTSIQDAVKNLHAKQSDQKQTAFGLMKSFEDDLKENDPNTSTESAERMKLALQQHLQDQMNKWIQANAVRLIIFL